MSGGGATTPEEGIARGLRSGSEEILMVLEGVMDANQSAPGEPGWNIEGSGTVRGSVTRGWILGEGDKLFIVEEILEKEKEKLRRC